MKQLRAKRNRYKVPQKLLNWLNLRPEEGERTLLMFTVLTVTSVGMLWVEQTSIVLFLDSFGANSLPLIYISSAIIGSGLGFVYSWLQSNWPIQKVLVAVVVIMALPLLLFRIGLEITFFQGIIGLLTVFLLRLWIDAQEILNELNAQLASNQLFNLREVKRTYPIISSGVLLADVIAGFSLPILLIFVGIKNILLLALFVILLGAILLFYITQIYSQSFPKIFIKNNDDSNKLMMTSLLRKSSLDYIIPLFIFLVMGKALYVLAEFHYLGQLEINFTPQEIASFLGFFSGVLGLFEITTQWFISSRIVENLGVFISSMFLPIFLVVIGIITILLVNILTDTNLTIANIFLFSAIAIKFFDELFHYTILAGIKPFLFQPFPINIRSSVQTLIQGVGEQIITGITGIFILAIVWSLNGIFILETPEYIANIQGTIFVAGIIFCSLIWAGIAWYLRYSYINLLVKEAEQGRLGFANFDIKTFKLVIIEALSNKQTDIDKSSCIDLLEKIDPVNAAEILAPRLLDLSPNLQKQSLEIMLKNPNREYVGIIQKLIYLKPPVEVLALSLRYIWLSQTKINLDILKTYLSKNIEAILRSTAATLILKRGNNRDKNEAIIVLDSMINSSVEKERVLGVGILKDGAQSFLIKRYLPNLLQEKSSTVRGELIKLIAEKKLANYYYLFLDGLYEKSLRKASHKSLLMLGNEVLPLLNKFSEDKHRSDAIRLQAWHSLSEIGTPETYNSLVQQLISSWGTTRRNLLRVILKIPDDKGLDILMDSLGRNGIETLIDQELLMLGQVYAGLIDLQVASREGELIINALQGMKNDIFERCFLLMQFLYPLETIQAIILNLNSDNSYSIDVGLELLDNGIDLPQKNIFLQLLEGGLPVKIKQLEAIKSIMSYQPMTAKDRLMRLITLRHFLSDWTLACCFHLARSRNWYIQQQIISVCLLHPSSFVREAILTYLKERNPTLCRQILLRIKNDPNPLVSALINQIKAELN